MFKTTSPYFYLCPLIEEARASKSPETRCLVEAALYYFKNDVVLDEETMVEQEGEYFAGNAKVARLNDFASTFASKNFNKQTICEFVQKIVDNYEFFCKTDFPLRNFEVALKYAAWKKESEEE